MMKRLFGELVSWVIAIMMAIVMFTIICGVLKLAGCDANNALAMVTDFFEANAASASNMFL